MSELDEVSKQIAETKKKLAELEEKQSRLSIPQPLEPINTKAIMGFALEVRDNICNGIYVNDDTYSDCFEIVMYSVFGDEFWAWYSKIAV
jgi:hypothetical protein